MRRRVKRKTFSKERIIMAASSVIVLSALTATGIWMRGEERTGEQDQVVDFAAIESQTAAEENPQLAENVTDQSVPADDLDYDPYFQETNSGRVENPDLSGSASMSEGSLLAGAASSEAGRTEDKALEGKKEGEKDGSGRTDSPEGGEKSGEQEGTGEGAPAISTAMQPALNFGDSDSLIWPVVGNILVNYSMDKTIYFPTLDQYKYNPAIVIQANEGDMITAAAAGKVTRIFEDPQIGTAVVMELGNGYEVTYGQLSGVLVSEGSYVSQGDLIAQVAAPTKYYSVEGTNVYFKLTKDGEPVNPMLRLNG